ncbi:MAG: stage V sporulation protein S [Peptostreptococcaceae bacterium]|nr:stage V sporulation protein S [Peptostreptococcaceae bacterium]
MGKLILHKKIQYLLIKRITIKAIAIARGFVTPSGMDLIQTCLYGRFSI